MKKPVFEKVLRSTDPLYKYTFMGKKFRTKEAAVASKENFKEKALAKWEAFKAKPKKAVAKKATPNPRVAAKTFHDVEVVHGNQSYNTYVVVARNHDVSIAPRVSPLGVAFLAIRHIGSLFRLHAYPSFSVFGLSDIDGYDRPDHQGMIVTQHIFDMKFVLLEKNPEVSTFSGDCLAETYKLG